VFAATSRDGGRTFSPAQKVTSGSVRSDQDQRIVTDPRTGYAYLTFDNSIQGGKGTGSYPAPAFDPTRNRLYVAYTDIVGGLGQGFLTWASGDDLSHWSTSAVIAPTTAGDRLNVELAVEPVSGRLDAMFYDRSWTGNALVDVTYVSSTDGGVVWSTQRVTTRGFDPAQYGVPSGGGVRPFIGDYNGIVSLAAGAAMTWTGAGKTYGALPTNYEIYFESVSAP
jgi:hypothetical protein